MYQIKKFATTLIKQNINKKLSFHLNLLAKAKISLTKRQTKCLLQTFGEEDMPNDKIYLFELEGIIINLENNIPELNNLPFFCEEKVINNSNNNELEEYILFSTPFHFKLLSEVKQIFIYSTFKSTPKNFYQILLYYYIT